MSPKRRSPLNNLPSASLSDKPEADEIPEEEEEEEDQEPEVARGGGDEDDDESEEEDEVDDESEEEEKSYPVSGSDSDSDCDSVTDSDSISVGSKRHAQTESSASVSRGRKKAKIWNGRIGQETNVEEEEDTEVDSKRFWSHYPLLKESMRSSLGSVPDNLLMKALKSIGRTKAKEMEEEWRELMLEEWRLRLRQIDFIKKQAQLILEALDSSKASEICQVSEIDDEYL